MRHLTVFCILFLANCSSGSNSTDAGTDAFDGADAGDDLDAGPDAGDTIDAGPDGSDAGPDGSDAGPRPDHDPESSILLEVPPDVSLCSRFSIARTWQQELAMIGRVDLKPGFYVLPREQGITEVEFVEAVLFGPDRQNLPAGPAAGELRAVYRDIAGPEWVYTFIKEFDLEGRPFRLEVTVPVAGNPDWPAGVVLDAGFMFDRVLGEATIGPGVEPVDEMQSFDLCDLPERGWHYSLTGEDGSTVVLDERFCTEPPEFCAGCTMCITLFAAEVTLDGVERIVTDRFEVIYSAGQHNLNPKYLVRLNPPIGPTAAVLVDSNPCYGGDIVALDANLVEIGRETVSDCQQNYRQ